MDNLIICDRCGSDACYVQEINQEIKMAIVKKAALVANLKDSTVKFFSIILSLSSLGSGLTSHSLNFIPQRYFFVDNRGFICSGDSFRRSGSSNVDNVLVDHSDSN